MSRPSRVNQATRGEPEGTERRSTPQPLQPEVRSPAEDYAVGAKTESERRRGEDRRWSQGSPKPQHHQTEQDRCRSRWSPSPQSRRQRAWMVRRWSKTEVAAAEARTHDPVSETRRRFKKIAAAAAAARGPHSTAPFLMSEDGVATPGAAGRRAELSPSDARSGLSWRPAAGRSGSPSTWVSEASTDPLLR